MATRYPCPNLFSRLGAVFSFQVNNPCSAGLYAGHCLACSMQCVCLHCRLLLRAFLQPSGPCAVCVCARASREMSVGSLVGELTTDVNRTVEHLKELGKMTNLF